MEEVKRKELADELEGIVDVLKTMSKNKLKTLEKLKS